MTGPELLTFLRKAFKSAQSRAKRSGLQFELTFEAVRKMSSDQDDRCAVSRISFGKRRFEEAFVQYPFSPSLDRVNCSQGYIASNVRLVCTAVNFGLGQWGEEVFRTIARSTLGAELPPAALPRSQITERIEAAEAVLLQLSETEQARQRRRIAALKRARTLGSVGLKRAARRARETASRPNGR